MKMYVYNILHLKKSTILQIYKYVNASNLNLNLMGVYILTNALL